MAKTYKIAVIPGDGIGKEVTPWAQKALEKAAEGVADFEYENFDLGAERYLRDGAILPLSLIHISRPGELHEIDPATGEDALLKRAIVLGNFNPVS